MLFQVSTSNIAKISLYTIKVTGYLLEPSVTSSMTFTVDVRNGCENTVITAPSTMVVNYALKDPS
jgi:hypothetical protein